MVGFAIVIIDKFQLLTLSRAMSSTKFLCKELVVTVFPWSSHHIF